MSQHEQPKTGQCHYTMQALQQHLHQIQSIITVDKTSLPSALRSRDIALMDQAAVKLSFTTHELNKCINAVRFFHRVTFISELCNVEAFGICSILMYL